MTKPARILWAEDCLGDIMLIKEAFKYAGLSYQLNVVKDGVEATDFLLQRGRYARSQRPDLVILDLNMPKKSGWEVIAEIKAAPDLSRIPLVVLTSSTSDRDAIDGLDPKHSLYLVKPSSFIALVNLAKQIHNFLSSLTGP
jgi:two-component system response regulator